MEYNIFNILILQSHYVQKLSKSNMYPCLGMICGLYLKSASSAIAILSQITAFRSCSWPVLSLHSPRVTRDDDRKCDPDGSHRPPASVLLRTPSMQRDHTARLKMPGPFTSTNIMSRLFIHVK